MVNFRLSFPRREGYEVVYEVVDTPTAMRVALECQEWDVITSDHTMPHFSATDALALAKELRPELPFIILSGEIDINLVVSLMKGGAQDYIQKWELRRIVPAIERELKEAESIRKHKQAEEALKESEERYRFLLRNTPDYVARYSITGILLFGSDSMYHMIGYKPEEIIGTSGFDRVHPDDRPQVQAKLKEAVKSDRAHKVQYRTLCKDGGYKWVEMSGEVVHNDQTGQDEVVAVVRDINERKRAEEELRESEERYRSLFENSVMGISQALPNGRLMAANTSYAQMCGYANVEEMLVEVSHVGQQLYANPAEREEVLHILAEKGTMKPKEIAIVRRDGTPFTVLVGTREIRDSHGNLLYYQAEHIDITEHKRAEHELQQSEERFRNLYQESPIPTFTWQKNGDTFILIDFNRAAIQITNGKARDLIGVSAVDLYKDRQQILSDMNLCFQARSFVRREFTSRNFAPGRHLSVHYAFIPPDLIIVQTEDQTERKRAELQLMEMERKFRTIADFTYDWENWIGVDGKPLWISPSVERISGYSISECMAMPDFPLAIIHPEDRDKVLTEMQKANEEPLNDIEVRIIKKDGVLMWGSVTAIPVFTEEGASAGHRSSIRDITERKQAEEALLESEERFRFLNELGETTRIMVEPREIMATVARLLSRHLRASRCAYAEVEADSERFTIQHDYTDGCASVIGEYRLSLFGPRAVSELREGRALVIADVDAELLPGEGAEMFNSLDIKAIVCCPLVKQGALRALMAIHQTTARQWTSGEVSLVQEVVERCWAIIERTRAEKELQESEKNYRRSLDDSPLGVRIVSTAGETIYANREILNIYGYKGIEELQKTSAKERYTAESYAEYLVRRKKRQRGEFVPPDYEISIVRKDGEIRRLQVYRKEILWNGKLQFQTLYNDITNRKWAEEKLQNTLESLRNAVGTTIQVMVSAVETRDPYTAGHQIRCADLARAMANEMGLPQDRIDGIRMAGSIHDIGKMSIPAEILSKPTKLSELEFSLIKEHANKGYIMLKDVESPWPLAEIVYQHHERMDGSGYPRHLKGEEILIEARILAVADVVEAMASHRPYRPAIGLDAALAEIENNKGTLYDEDAVDACLILFREKGFQLERA